MTDEKLVYESLDAESNQVLQQYFDISFRKAYVKCKGHVVPEYFQHLGDKIRQMDVRDDDIWMCTYPRTGTTWTQEMVWCISNDVDFEAAKESLWDRFPFLELSAYYDDKKVTRNRPPNIDSIDFVDSLPSPRFIKTHLPFDLLPEKLQNNSTLAKMIYVSRNPRDACISFYHFCKLMEGYNGTFQQFAEMYLEGNVPFGCLWSHVKGFWQRKNALNILFVTYEDMKMNLESVIYKTAKFLGKTLNEDSVKKLLDHLSFSNMKRNPAVNFHSEIEFVKKRGPLDENSDIIRRGETGQWKGIMDSTLCERFEKLEKELFEETKFSFSFI